MDHEQAGDAERQATHLGERFDAQVAEALRRQRPRGKNPDYDTVREHLDPAHYLLQAPWLLGNAVAEPVRHYLRQGAKTQLSPEINFSTTAYLGRHPERGQAEEHPYLAWLREGRAAGELGDPAQGLEKVARVLGTTPAELADQLAATRSDLQHRLRHGTLGEMFAKAAQVDPTIADAWAETARPKLTPVPTRLVADQMGAIHTCHEAAGHARARMVVVAGTPHDALAGRLVRDLCDLVGPADVVVVLTDDAGDDAGALPTGVRRVDYAGAVTGLTTPQAQPVLVELLRSFGAECVVGVGSAALLEALTPYGKALRASERLFLAFGGLEEGQFGNPRGAALRSFYRHLDVVEGFLAEDPALITALGEIHQLPPAELARVHVLPEALPGSDLGSLLTSRPADE